MPVSGDLSGVMIYGFVMGSERSAGVIIFKNNFNRSILSDSDHSGHFLCHVVSNIIVNIYGYNSKLQNDQLFDSIGKCILHWLAVLCRTRSLNTFIFMITMN